MAIKMDGTHKVDAEQAIDPKPYRKKEWARFRDEVLELDNSVCRQCGRGEKDGVILQVHHIRYVKGKLPWEYAYSDCETLCKGCHASVHGHIKPTFGWEFLGYDDLGELDGHCEHCNTEIRYVYYIQHPHWEPMGVGTFCCDFLTGTKIASNQTESLKRFISRRQRFTSSSRWKSGSINSTISQKGIKVSIQQYNDFFSILMNGRKGKKIFKSLREAKEYAFEVIDNGAASEYLDKIEKSLSKPK